ncbi:hypothetical protein GBF38_012503 [Nibea albiflora]|uniref:Uncharacterized protein n=1 Tax=Nibea albiflora TaxID=240163 RepID=A0ACB7EIT2_NIBAL|nr:hypothetical protein GBF38_012503 [Nibea albiflora]
MVVCVLQRQSQTEPEPQPEKKKAPPKSKKAKEVKAKPEEEKKEEPQAEKEEAPAENGEAKAEEVLHVCLIIMKFASCCYVLYQCSRRTETTKHLFFIFQPAAVADEADGKEDEAEEEKAE